MRPAAVEAPVAVLRAPLRLGKGWAAPISTRSIAPASRITAPLHRRPTGRSGSRRCARLRVAASAQRGAVELLLDNVAGKGELLSPKLDPDVRQRATRAIKQRGGRVTIGDVASTAGLRLEQAEQAVRALAADSQAALEVSQAGDVVYAFPLGFQEAIASKSLLLRLEPAAAGLKGGAEYLGRVAFGTALLASIAIVFTALMVLASSRDDNDNGRGSRSGGGGGGGGYYGGGPRFYFDLTDLLWYWDPFYYRRRRERLAAQRGRREDMNFLEAIFSWVFGDGDPNADFDKKRWQAIGRYISSRGGTVVAEELAPFLDLTPSQLSADRGRITVDESFMLPVLARFNGTPQVDQQGDIVYTFPDLQITASASAPLPSKAPMAQEQRWQLTAASPGQRLAAVALGVANLVGVAALTFALGDPVNRLALARNGLLGVLGLMPWLQAYAAAFFAIPFVRWLRNGAANAAIDARNAAREQAARLLAQPDAQLQRKLAGAQRAAVRKVVRERDAVYRSDRPLEAQPVDVEAENFEARLERRARERQQQQQQQQQRQPPSREPQPSEQPPQWWLDQRAERKRR